ncbi:MAG: osmosensitive channel signal transduction histidine kinase [Thermoleophilia bacterium]|nr:osmosensitive channel signal transduction histidine kinase [Thermoleophilia bacterium]
MGTMGDDVHIESAVPLLALAEQLAAAMSLAEISHVVATLGVEALGAASGFVALTTQDERALEMYAYIRPDKPDVPLCRLEATEVLPVIEAWRFGVPIYAGTAADLTVRYPVLDMGRSDREALAALPLEVDGLRMGAINLSFSTPQAFDAAQQASLRALAGLCAQAVRRERLTRDVERMRNDFIVTASHELRTPLAAIYGAAVALSSFDISDEARAELSRMIVGQSERMRTVIDDLRYTADIDTAEPLAVVTTRVRVDELLRDATAYWLRMPSTSQQVRVDVPGDLPDVAADGLRLQQVIANLVDNACKYAPADTTVRLTAERVGDAVRIDVRDEGPGMASADLERAFEKFFRADPLNRTGAGGTGLGLFVARRLVDAMGGRIWLEDLGDGMRSISGDERHGLRASIELPLWPSRG